MNQLFKVKKPTGPTTDADFFNGGTQFSTRKALLLGDGGITIDTGGLKYAELALQRNPDMLPAMAVGRYTGEHREQLLGLLQLPIGKLSDDQLSGYLTMRWNAVLDETTSTEGREAYANDIQNLTRNQKDSFVVWMYGAFSSSQLASIKIVYGEYEGGNNVLFNRQFDGIDTSPEKFTEYQTKMLEAGATTHFVFPRLLFIILDLLFTNLFGVSNSMTDYVLDDNLLRFHGKCMYVIATKYQKVLQEVMTTTNNKPIPLEAVCYNMRIGIFNNATRNMGWYTNPAVPILERMQTFTLRVLDGINMKEYVENFTTETLGSLEAVFEKMRVDFKKERRELSIARAKNSEYEKLLVKLAAKTGDSDSEELDPDNTPTAAGTPAAAAATMVTTTAAMVTDA